MIAASTKFPQRALQHDGGLQHPLHRRPEFAERRAQRMRRGVRHRIRTRRGQSSTRLGAAQAAHRRAGSAGGEPATFVAGLGSITVAEVMMGRLLWQITGCDDIRPAFTRVFPASGSGSIHCFGLAEDLRESRSGGGHSDG